jgi:hypothetical protein
MASRWSPWISIWPSLTVPPVPHVFCIFFARASFSGSPMPTKFFTTVTVFPPRPALERMMSTRPRLRLGAGGVGSPGLPGGRPVLSRAANGLLNSFMQGKDGVAGGSFQFPVARFQNPPGLMQPLRRRQLSGVTHET